MTPIQKTAYQHPCFHAHETTQERFYWRDRDLIAAVTANVGIE